MSNMKSIILAAIAAAVLDVISLVCLRHIGIDGPDSVGWVGVILLSPTMVILSAIAPLLDMVPLGPIGEVVLPLIGFLQFFGIFWASIRLVLFLLRRRHEKQLA